MTFGNKMRWIAGGLYGLLAIYQLYIVKPVLVAANLANAYLTWIYAILLAIGAAAMCVWMFHGRVNVSGGAKRAIVAGSVLTIIFELMTYTEQTDLINYAVYSVLPDQVNNTTLLYILMVLRLLLIILAAFFVTSSKDPDKRLLMEADEADEAEDADTVVVVEEDVIVIEDDEETESEAEDKAEADEEPKKSEEEKVEADDKKSDEEDEETEKTKD